MTCILRCLTVLDGLPFFYIETFSERYVYILNDKAVLCFITHDAGFAITQPKANLFIPIFIPPNITHWVDGGFLGYKPETVIVKMPDRKPRGKALSKEHIDAISFSLRR
jgi:hypothetical protein